MPHLEEFARTHRVLHLGPGREESLGVSVDIAGRAPRRAGGPEPPAVSVPRQQLRRRVCVLGRRAPRQFLRCLHGSPPGAEARGIRGALDAALLKRRLLYRPVTPAPPLGPVVRLLHRGDPSLRQLRLLHARALSRARAAADARAPVDPRPGSSARRQPLTRSLRTALLLHDAGPAASTWNWRSSSSRSCCRLLGDLAGRLVAGSRGGRLGRPAVADDLPEPLDGFSLPAPAGSGAARRRPFPPAPAGGAPTTVRLMDSGVSSTTICS